MAIKTYVSVGGQRKQLKKWYASIGGARRELQKVYASVNGVRKLIYTKAKQAAGIIFSHKKTSDSTWTTGTYYADYNLRQAINQAKNTYGSTQWEFKIEEEVGGNGFTTNFEDAF